MNKGKSELNAELKALVGTELESLGGKLGLKLQSLNSREDSVVFERDGGKRIRRKFSQLRILVDNLIDFPAINPALVLGRSYSSIKELVTLLANAPSVSYFKVQKVIYLTLESSVGQVGLKELLPRKAEAVIARVFKFESLDRKVLLQELVDVYNTLGIIEKEQDYSSLKELIKHLRDFKEHNDAIFGSLSNYDEWDRDDLEIYGDQNDLEDQAEESNSERQYRFDPSKLDIKTLSPTVDLLMSRVDHNEIILNPDFQRNSRIWKDKDKSALIESILLKIPIPIFYMSAMPNDKWLIVDGLQRITTSS